ADNEWEYADAKRTLDEQLRERQMLNMKIAAEKIDVDLPKTSMVQIIDQATAGSESPGVVEKLRRAVGGVVQRSARVKIERDQSDIAGMSDSRWNGAYDPYFIQTEKEVIQSERVLGKVVESL